MADPIAIVGCGRRKLDGPCRADQLYIGTLFAARWRAARVIAPGRAWIISAKYGLLRPGQEISCYDMTLRDPEAVWEGDIRRQAAGYQLLACPVTVLASAPYAVLVARAWPEGSVIDTPLAHLGIGQQMARCNELAGAAPGAQLARPARDRPRPHRSA